MNKIILEAISFIGIGILITVIFSVIRKQVINKTANIVKEKFDTPKFLHGMLNLLSPTDWAKDICNILNIRKITIYLIIIGVIFAYGYFKGQAGKPVQFMAKYEEEMIMKLDGTELYKPKNSYDIYVRDSKTKEILKQIKQKDIPSLRKQLRPYGLMLEPIGIIGGGISNVSTDFEGGIGIRYLKFFKWYADICMTNRGIYPIGISYRITDNSALGVSVGTGYKNFERGLFERILLKYSWKF
jgi:hypothetical protein